MKTWFVELVPPGWQWVMETIWAVVIAVIVIAIALLSVAIFNWLERKIAGRTQDRLGPHRVGGRFGWLQSPADGIKLLCKEDLVPTEADPILFRLAPYLGLTAAFTVFFVVPFADGWAAQQVNSAAFMALAILGMDVFGTVLAGLSSGSKYSLLGGMRAAAQMVSYEVPLGMCVVIPVMCFGTMDLNVIGEAQSGWFWHWGIFANPFMFVTFFVFLVCATAGCNRAPFDMAEAESELVAGFMTEYSGFRWAAFFMGEYTSMVVICGLGSILFLGGWNGPIPWTEWVWLSEHVHPALGWIGNCCGAIGFLAKIYILIAIMMWARWSLPRLRVDQVMTMCLKYCFPITAAMFLGAMLWMAAFPG
ncbi:MAG: NADH-quinone oxidoreductase subunit NuoH [Thermoguttaceae bacterium]|nr:NADH-quinone oxidoreductase subunit NuoH [Thermoguttaceae bacterium]